MPRTTIKKVIEVFLVETTTIGVESFDFAQWERCEGLAQALEHYNKIIANPAQHSPIEIQQAKNRIRLLMSKNLH